MDMYKIFIELKPIRQPTYTGYDDRYAKISFTEQVVPNRVFESIDILVNWVRQNMDEFVESIHNIEDKFRLSWPEPLMYDEIRVYKTDEISTLQFLVGHLYVVDQGRGIIINFKPVEWRN